MKTLVIETLKRWIRNDGLGLAAAVSFYSIFAMVPLIVLALMLSIQFSGSISPNSLVGQALVTLFPDTDLDYMLASLKHHTAGKGFSGLSLTAIIVLLWAASGVFSRLQLTVGRLFEESTESLLSLLGISVMGKLKMLLLTLGAGLVLAIGSAASSACLACYQNMEFNSSLRLELITAFLITIGGILIILASVKKRPSVLSLAVTGVLFFVLLLIGRLGVSIYLANSTSALAFGIASSIIVVMIWIYFAAILYGICTAFCAELSDR